MSLSLMQITHAHEEIITRETQPDCLMCSNYHVRTSRRKAETVRYGARRDLMRRAGRPAARPAFRRTIAIQRKAISMDCPETVLTWLLRLWESGDRWHPAAPHQTSDQTQSGFMKKVNRRPN